MILDAKRAPYLTAAAQCPHVHTMVAAQNALLVLLGTTCSARNIHWFADVSVGKTSNGCSKDDTVSCLDLTLASIKAYPHLFGEKATVLPSFYPNEDEGVGHRLADWRAYPKAQIDAWRKPIQAAGAKCVPYVVDASDIFAMEAIWANQTLWIADAVALAVEIDVDGWFVDFEAEHPDGLEKLDQSARFAYFVDAFAVAMHAKNKTLGMYVTDPWEATDSNYAAFGKTAVDFIYSGALYLPTDAEWKNYGALQAAVGKDAPRRAVAGLGPYAVLESITGRRPAWDIFKPLYLAQIELVFHDS